MENINNAAVDFESTRLHFAKMGLFWGLLSGAFWGLNGVMLGMVLEKEPFLVFKSFSNKSELQLLLMMPLLTACIHDGIASIWLFIVNLLQGKIREIPRSLNVKSGKMVALGALFGGPLAMTGYLLSMKFTASAYTMAITACYPALGSIFAVIFLKEKISRRALIGILFCVLGPLVIAFSNDSTNSQINSTIIWGILLAFIPTFGWAFEGVVSTYAMDLLDPSVAINIRQLTSFLLYAVIGIPLFVGLDGFHIVKDLVLNHPFTTFPFLWLTALAGALSYLFWYRSMNMTGVGRAMALNITYALWAIFFGYFLTDLEITMNLIVGALLITGGALLVVANPKELINLRN